MKQLLIKQMEFEHWANAKLLESLKQAQPLDERAELLFAHIQNTSNMWLCRVTGQPITTTLFQERTLAESELLLAQNTEGWSSYLKKAKNEELNRIFEFVSPLDGIKRTISVSDAVMHIVHHSSYHRGQIVVRIKGSVEPLPFVLYLPFSSKIVAE